MDKSNLELFKQAISEGLSEKFDSIVDSCTEKIVCSEKHNMAMRMIVYGKTDTKRTWSPRMKRIIAILVAVALLLTSCAAIFHNEIREIVDELFAKYVYSGDETNTDVIEEVYELTYLPDGYLLNDKNIRHLRIQWKYIDESNNIIIFEQRICDRSDFTVDSESGYSQIKEIEKYDVYYRFTEKYNSYIWSDDKYAFELMSNQALTNKEIESIINGIK